MQDLLHRINIHEIRIPPLRGTGKRPVLLADHFSCNITGRSKRQSRNDQRRPASACAHHYRACPQNWNTPSSAGRVILSRSSNDGLTDFATHVPPCGTTSKRDNRMAGTGNYIDEVLSPLCRQHHSGLRGNVGIARPHIAGVPETLKRLIVRAQTE